MSGRQVFIGTRCPICSNAKVLEGYNDLVTTNPKLAKELTSKGTGTKIVSKEFETMPKIFLKKKTANPM